MTGNVPEKNEQQTPLGETELTPNATQQQDQSPFVVAQRRGMWGKGSPDTSGYAGMRRTVEFEGLAQRPYGGWFDAVADRMEALVPGFGADRVIIHRDEITFHVRPEALPALARALRDDEQLRFEILSGVSGVHYPGDEGHELHVVYHLLSITHNRRIRVEVSVPETDPRVPSLVPTYPMADYHERETWDMFGVVFDGHPHLTRVLMPDDWSGHPQRKDYPLGGIPVEYKGATVPPPDQRRSY